MKYKNTEIVGYEIAPYSDLEESVEVPKKFTFVGTLFGANLLLETNDKIVVKMASKWLEEAREKMLNLTKADLEKSVLTDTVSDLRNQIIDEIEARRVDHKTYIDAAWLLNEYETTIRKDFLRSEIEELEGKLAEALERPMRHFNGNENYDYNEGYSNALTSIITRYKEELKGLEKGI